MSLTRAALRFAAPAPKPESFARCLFIGPHPDDIEIGAGATAARFAAEGKALSFLIAIDGRYGSENAPEGVRGDALAALRREEALRSARLLGVEDVRFLGLCDGGFYAYEDLVTGLARAVGDFQPEILFAPDPWVSSECHVDHRRVGRAAAQIACFAPYGEIMARYGARSAPVSAIAFYMTAKANRFVGVRDSFALQQRAIFDCHRSQFPEGCAQAKAIGAYLNLRSLDFGLRSFQGRAEGFRVLSSTQMHCLPEAGD